MKIICIYIFFLCLFFHSSLCTLLLSLCDFPQRGINRGFLILVSDLLESVCITVSHRKERRLQLRLEDSCEGMQPFHRLLLLSHSLSQLQFTSSASKVKIENKEYELRAPSTDAPQIPNKARLQLTAPAGPGPKLCRWPPDE